MRRFNLGLSALVAFMFLTYDVVAQINFTVPSGDWDYYYEGNEVQTGTTTALDGTWKHEHTGDWDPDDWDGTAPGEVGSTDQLNGGVQTYLEDTTTFARLQDVGYIGDKPNNNRINFTRALPADAMLNNGITIALRLRLATPDQGHPLDGFHGAKDWVNESIDGEWPSGGKGVDMRNGMGLLTLAQTSSVDVTKVEQIGLTFLNQVVNNDLALKGFAMNNLVGNTMLTDVREHVDAPARATAVYTRNNIVEVADPTDWQEFWIQISPDGTEGTHQVEIWHNGSKTSTVYNVTSTQGSAMGNNGLAYIMLGAGVNNGNASAFDLDYLAYKTGLIAPVIIDCHGDMDGDATIDDCKVCSGGNTGIVPNSTCEQDCNGDWDGSAYLDDCDECVGGLTGKLPCGQYKKDRALVVRQLSDNKVYMSWRLFAGDHENVGFNVYRKADASADAELRTSEPITQTTDFIDEAPASSDAIYFVVPVVNGIEGEASREKGISGTPGIGYFEFPLEHNVSGMCYGIADLNGDGALDYVVKSPDQHIDPWPSIWHASYGSIKLDAYTNEGEFLWRFDVGRNIEKGIWYFPYVVADFDGDGLAEVALKHSDDGDYSNNGSTRVMTGPEYIRILNGLTGESLAYADWPSREGFEIEPYETENYPETEGYNRASRNLMVVAYTEGEDNPPIIIAHRGTYGRMKTFAYSFDGTNLTKLWEFDTDEKGEQYEGQGSHFMHAVDVDGDNKDEIVLGSTVLKGDGTVLWSTGMGHPDACYLGDIIPDRPGLEIYYGYESRQNHSGLTVRDAATGEKVWGSDFKTNHIHDEGMVADVLAEYPGMECFGGEDAGDPNYSRYLFSANGELISTNPVTPDNGDGDGRDNDELKPSVIYWDADLLSEQYTNGGIIKFPYEEGKEVITQIGAERGFYIADIVGDWREELIEAEGSTFRIYATTIPSVDRHPWLMDDPVYRRDVTNSTHGYVQHPMLGRMLMDYDHYKSLLEAEDACSLEGTIETTLADYSGTGYVVFNSGESTAQWMVGSDKEVLVDIKIYYTAATDSKLKLLIADELVAEEIEFPAASDWSYVTVQVTAPEGVNTLVLKTIDGTDAPSIDRLEWNNDFFGARTCDPDCNNIVGGVAEMDDCGICAGEGTGIEPNTSCTTTLQAEDACSFVSGYFDNTNENYTGEGYIRFSLETDAAIQYKLNSVGENTINLDIRYANASNSNPSDLYVNGELQNDYVAFRNTGSTSNWYIATTEVQLSNGENTIELKTKNRGIPILDALYWNHQDVTAIDCKPVSNACLSEENILVYPNPVTDVIILEHLMPGLIAIYDMNGKRMNEVSVEGTSVSIPVSELPQGIYLIKFKSNDGAVNASIKIMK